MLRALPGRKCVIVTRVNTSRRRTRVDETGLAYGGSMLQIQLFVNDRPEDLNTAILNKLPELASLRPKICWRSPLREDGYREYRDGEFLRALGFPELAPRLAEWWPPGGPHWDALARLEFPDGAAGILLAEGKSYPREMYDKTGTRASAASLEKISRALRETQRWLDVDQPVNTWLRPLYQTANRLATLYWLIKQLGADRAWLVHLCFVNDQTHEPPNPTTQRAWEDACDEAQRKLGIGGPIPNYAHLFLNGLPSPRGASELETREHHLRDFTDDHDLTWAGGMAGPCPICGTDMAEKVYEEMLADGTVATCRGRYWHMKNEHGVMEDYA